jgi:hypothetical protein
MTMDERNSAGPQSFEGALALDDETKARVDETKARVDARRKELEAEMSAAPELGSKTDLFALPSKRIERIYVAPWKAWVNIKTITGEKRDEFEASLVTMKPTADGGLVREPDLKNIRAKLLVHCICDKDGNELMSSDDIKELGQMDAAGLTICYNKASEMNAVSDDDVKELAKNFGRGATVTG